MRKIMAAYAFKFRTNPDELWSLGLERAWKYYKDDGNPFLGWWNRCMRNICIDLYRRAKRDRCLVNPDGEFWHPSTTTQDPDVRNKIARSLRFIRREWGSANARMLWMKGMGHREKEIQQEFGINSEAVKGRIHRMRKDLEEWESKGCPDGRQHQRRYCPVE